MENTLIMNRNDGTCEQDGYFLNYKTPLTVCSPCSMIEARIFMVITIFSTL